MPRGQNSVVGDVAAWLQRSTCNAAYVGSDPKPEQVLAVRGTPPYLRSRADNEWNYNRLYAPQY